MPGVRPTKFLSPNSNYVLLPVAGWPCSEAKLPIVTNGVPAPGQGLEDAGREVRIPWHQVKTSSFPAWDGLGGG